MPELVLYDDAGVVLSRAKISEENVRWLARVLRRHRGMLRAAASLLRAFDQAKAAAEQIAAPAPDRGRRR